MLVNADSGRIACDTVKLHNDTVNYTVKPKRNVVFSLIKTTPNITAVKIAEKTGLGTATVKREIKRLKECGTIERTGSDKTGHWKISKDVE